jgi:hypothetical protein
MHVLAKKRMKEHTGDRDSRVDEGSGLVGNEEYNSGFGIMASTLVILSRLDDVSSNVRYIRSGRHLGRSLVGR